MDALLRFRYRLLRIRLATLVAMLVVPVAMAQTNNNLTAGDALMPPQYITSPSGGFAFGFRAVDSDPTNFLLATWFRFADDGSSSQPQPRSVVWFLKETTMGSALVAPATSVLNITADGRLMLTDTGGEELWTARTRSLQRGSVLALSDSGNVRFLGDGDIVLWESFREPSDTLLPGQPLSANYSSFGGFLVSKRADAEFTTGRFSLAAQPDGNVVLYIDLFTADYRSANAYLSTNTVGPNGNTTVALDDRGFLNYRLQNGSVHTLISPEDGSNVGDYLRYARMDPDGIVRTYTRPRNGGGRGTPWTVSGALPGDGGCNRATSTRQLLCGQGSYCVETKERLRCMCPTGYTYIDAQHTDSGCTPAFDPPSCSGEKSGSDEFSLVEMPSTTWENSAYYYNKYPSVTEEQCRNYCLSHCYCAAALMMGGSDCVEVGALTSGRQADDVATKALIKVRVGNTSHTQEDGPAATYKIVTIVCMLCLLLIAIGGLVAQRYYLLRNSDSRRPLYSGVRVFSWKELHQATNGFKILLGKGSFGEVYKGTLRSP
ncbi:hypothetical protein ZWY2020_041694 [Hordeum vulgare]|nr:hypothetical protein ZWY2020_041694 [Hordeum vulgare]